MPSHLLNREPHPGTNFGSRHTHRLIKTTNRAKTVFSWYDIGPSSSYLTCMAFFILPASYESCALLSVRHKATKKNQDNTARPRRPSSHHVPAESEQEHSEQAPEDQQVDDHGRHADGHVRGERYRRLGAEEVVRNPFEHQRRRVAVEPAQTVETWSSLDDAFFPRRGRKVDDRTHVPLPPILAENGTAR